MAGSLPAHLIVLWRQGRFDLPASAEQVTSCAARTASLRLSSTPMILAVSKARSSTDRRQGGRDHGPRCRCRE
jgi:hypothetical protein